ncbi:MAG: HypC/HybG/HupF family hydrogenase formation chaperone [candidate division WWE3 bacterium]|nr:HypC/HybG/HupF family hydrogenase formation chaperone [candidate division WWE3 bacterium]
MCLAIPGKILNVEGQRVTVAYPGQTRDALAGGEDVKVGDFVMVQMGVVVKILTAKDAAIARSAWEVRT